MNLKIYAHKPGPVSRAFLQVFGLTNDELNEVTDASQADIILLTGADDLRTVYNPRQLFCVLQTNPREKIANNQPENVSVIDAFNLFNEEKGIARFVAAIEKHKQKQAIESRANPNPVQFPDIAVFKKSYSVLVIDDTNANLELAKRLLNGHSLTVASHVELAVKEMENKHFDAVLTDMQLRPDCLYPSLNLRHYGVTETIPYGFAVVFEATKRGIPVAVVTDGSHHDDWVSAMFDHIREATVNGQRVLFFNHIGKRWDKALKELLEG